MKTRLIQENSVFRCLERVALDRVLRSANPQTYPKAHWITHQGTIWPYLFLVEDGIVQAVKESVEGRSLIVTEVKPGELFWGISFFLPQAEMPVALVAKEESRLVLWSREDLQPIILANGSLSWALTCLMIEKMQFASEKLQEFAFQPTTGRLARVLLENFGEKAGDFVARDMTLDEMAARIGSTREMVCRHLYHFADQGVIEINRTEFKIVDPDQLKDLSRK